MVTLRSLDSQKNDLKMLTMCDGPDLNNLVRESEKEMDGAAGEIRQFSFRLLVDSSR